MLRAYSLALLATMAGTSVARDELPSMAGATTWLNSPPLTPAGLRGKVVLVDIWTYTCINWLRTLPYVRAWAEKYRAYGLVVIGVHAPEFSFEKDLDNVRREVGALGITYPVAVDNAHAIWAALNNEAWPALYFVDAKGRIRRQRDGEGGYAEAEQFIQQLLAENGQHGFSKDPVTPKTEGFGVAADWSNLQSQENYTGYDRTLDFSSPGGAFLDQTRAYTIPARLTLNQWAVSGKWLMGHESLSLKEPNGRLVYRFHARDVNLVMGPATRGTAVRFRIRVDGEPPGAAHGLDVDETGNGQVTEQRLYQLFRLSRPIRDRLIEIEFLDPGVQIFSFTFG